MSWLQLVNPAQPTNDRYVSGLWNVGGKCLIRGTVAGTHKSYMGEQFKNLGYTTGGGLGINKVNPYNVLFVVPTNSRSQEKETRQSL